VARRTYDVREGEGLSLTLYPPERWATPVASVLSPAGVELATPTVTQSSTSTSVATTTTSAYLVELDSVTGINPGDYLEFTQAEAKAVAKVASVRTGAVVELTPALPFTPSAGDTVLGLGLSLTVPSSATGDRGENYAVIVTDSADPAREERATFHVVRRKFLPPITALEVREIVQDGWPGETFTEHAAERIADQVHHDCRQALLKTGRYAHAYVDAAAFGTVAESMVRMRLAQRGLYPAGVDREDYLRELRSDQRVGMAELIQAFVSIDTDDDGAVDEQGPSMFTRAWSL
jgi:hypothetical protein